MGAIYQADVWCDGCADCIKERLATDMWANRVTAVTPDGVKVSEFADFDELTDHLDCMSERDYDSDDYPKYCSDDEECDSPQHCAAQDDCVDPIVLDDGFKVGHFFGNSLTTDGEDYVKNTVRDDIESGHTDSVACTVWAPYYDWIDWEDIGTCTGCNNLREGLDDDDYCEDCAACMAEEDFA